MMFAGLLVVVAATAVFAAEEHPAGDAAHSVAVAESDPASAGDDAVHAATADGGHEGDHGDAGHGEHNPYSDALHGNAGEGQLKPEEWRMSLSLWTLVVFGLLTAILWKFAWGPIRDALDQREASVAANIAAAKEQNEKAASLLADHETRLAGAADEVRKIIDDARREADVQKQGILAEAQAAAESEKNRAVKEIEAAKNGALQELAEKSVDTAVGLAGRIVQRQLSADDHSSLIADALKHFPSKN